MEMLKTKGTDLKGKTVLISGSGNVAQYTAEKVLQLGGKVLTMSDSDGYIYDPDGIDREKLDYIMELKNLYRGRIREYAEKYGCKYVAGARPWGEKADIALPSATQNEINGDQARQLVANGVMGRERRRQHAFYSGSHPRIPGSQDSVRTGQGSQCRRRIGFRSRNEPELRTSVLDIGRGRCPSARHHGEHSSELREVRNGSRRLRQLREGCQHRRFHEGSQGYDGSRYRIRFNHRIHKGTEECLHSLRPFLCPFSYRPMPRNRTITHSDVTVPSLVRAQRNPSSLPPPDSEAGLYVQALRHTLSNFRDYLRRDGKV